MVDKRSTIDPLLGEIFNDPSATSLTKTNLDDGDDADSFSGSGSDVGSASGDSPKQPEATPSQDTAQQSTTVITPTYNITETPLNVSAKNDNNTDTALQTADSNTENVPPASMTSVPMTSSQDADVSQQKEAKLPPTEDQSQNKVVESEEKSDNTTQPIVPVTPNLAVASDAVAGQASPGNSDASVAPAFDDKQMYDATIVKKNEVPVAYNPMVDPLGE